MCAPAARPQPTAAAEPTAPRVCGVGLDGQSRCAHYHSPLDVVALRFGCCGEYYACHLCHEQLASHPAQPWPLIRALEPAVRCGVCGTCLTAAAYLASGNQCPYCGAGFNPGCAQHYGLYFEGM